MKLQKTLRPRHADLSRQSLASAEASRGGGSRHAVASRGGGFTLPQPRARAAFTLIELLVVIGIISVLMVLLVPAFTTRKGADDVTKGVSDVTGALENARTFAMANNTYAWVGFFEEDVANTPSTSPRPAGTGRIIISVVASKNGNRYKDTQVDATEPHAFYPPPGPSPIAGNDSNPVILTQVGKLIQVENTHLAVLPATVAARPSVDSEFQVAANDFANHPHNAPGSPAVLNPTTFNYPLSAASPNIAYTFTKIIECSFSCGTRTRMLQVDRMFDCILRAGSGYLLEGMVRFGIAILALFIRPDTPSQLVQPQPLLRPLLRF